MYKKHNHLMNHLMKLYLKSHYKAFHFHQQFYCILQLICQLCCFYTYKFYNRNIFLCYYSTIFIIEIFFYATMPLCYHSHLQVLGLKIRLFSNIHSSINSLHSHLHLSSLNLCLLLQTFALNPHMHLQVSCHIICLVFFILGIKLNTFTFMFLMISGTGNLVYVSLILLQLPLH